MPHRIMNEADVRAPAGIAAVDGGQFTLM